MSKLKKMIAVGAMIGIGAYALVKLIVPKVSVICEHDDDEEDEFKSCCKHCDKCFCPDDSDELPDEVKSTIGEMESMCGFDASPKSQTEQENQKSDEKTQVEKDVVQSESDDKKADAECVSEQDKSKKSADKSAEK